MERTKGLLGFFLLGALMPSVFAEPFISPEPHKITWAQNDGPPFHILDGEYQGQGFCDVLVEEMIRTMPDSEHEVLTIPPARVARFREARAPVCFPCMIKRPDTDITRYSRPTLYYQPFQLIVNPSLAPLIRQRHGSPTNFVSLIKDDTLHFGRPLGRDYGESLQPLLDKYADQGPNHRKLSGKSTRVLSMVALGRLDFTLDYPVIGRYFALTGSGSLTSLPIQQDQHNPIIGAIGCSNTDWGKDTVSKIDAALEKVLRSEKYLASLEFWFASTNSAFWQQYQDRVLSDMTDHEPSSRPKLSE